MQKKRYLEFVNQILVDNQMEVNLNNYTYYQINSLSKICLAYLRTWNESSWIILTRL